MKYLSTVLGVVFASAVVTGCYSQPPEEADGSAIATETPVTTPVQMAGDSNMQSKEPESMEMGRDEVKDSAQAFMPAGAKLLEASKGDINGDGIEDALLVIDPPAPGNLAAGENGPNRIVMLVLGGGAMGNGTWPLVMTSWCRVPPAGA